MELYFDSTTPLSIYDVMGLKIGKLDSHFIGPSVKFLEE